MPCMVQLKSLIFLLSVCVRITKSWLTSDITNWRQGWQIPTHHHYSQFSKNLIWNMFNSTVHVLWGERSLRGKKVLVLLRFMMGSSSYTLLSDLTAPAVLKSNTAAVQQKHYESNKAVIAEGFHFHKHDQALEESVAECDLELGRLVMRCKFEGYIN